MSGFSQVVLSVYNSSNSSLPDNNVYCIATDQNKNHWVGTDFGLVRIDSMFNWTVFNTGNSGLPNNSIRCMYIDDQNQKWFGTFAGGIALYNDTNWTVFNTQNSPLPDDHVRSIDMDDSSFVWAATTGGIAVFKDTSWTIYNMFNSPLMSNNIADIYIDDSTVYLGTINGGLVIIEDTTWSVFTFPNQLPDNTVLGLDKDANGNVWMAFANAGIGARVPQTGSILLYNTSTSTIASNNATSILVKSLNTQYAGTIDKGLIIKKGVFFQNLDSTNSAMPDSYVRCMNLSMAELWIGTATEGLVIVDELSLGHSENTFSKTGIHLFPNPVSDLFFIEAKVKLKQVEIYTLRGQLLKRYHIDEYSTSIDVEKLVAGIYLVSVIDAKDHQHHLKIIKQ